MFVYSVHGLPFLNKLSLSLLSRGKYHVILSAVPNAFLKSERLWSFIFQILQFTIRHFTVLRFPPCDRLSLDFGPQFLILHIQPLVFFFALCHK